MKTLLKHKVSADQTSQLNGVVAGNRVTTRQSVVASAGLKLELVDPNRKIPAPVDLEMSTQKPQPMQTGVKRAYATTFSTAGPVYASSVSVQQTSSRDGMADDESYESSSAASYTQPAKKAAGSSSVLRNTLSTPRDNDSVRTKNRPGRKPTKAVDHMTDEEYRRLEDRRQKNKEAAQRCRSRRMAKIQELEERIKALNGDINELKSMFDKYKLVPNELQNFLSSNMHVCCLASTPPARPIQMPIITPDVASLNKPSSSTANTSNFNKTTTPAKTLNSPTTRTGIKRPQFLNRPINNLIAEQKRPSSQPSPSVINLPSFSLVGTPGHGADFFAGSWQNGTTPGLASFGGNGDGNFLMDDKTPSRDLSGLYNALDLQSSYALETPNAETPRLTAL